MNFIIDRIDVSNYHLFDDMVFWRENGFEREPKQIPITEQIKKELDNPNLYVYAAMSDNKYVAWISAVYIPKVGRWKGNGHIYVDELWVEPNYRGRGLAKALLEKADELSEKLAATGIRLYVNVDNPVAKSLYKSCGYTEAGQAYFMEK